MWGGPHRPDYEYRIVNNDGDPAAPLNKDQHGQDGPNPLMGPQDRRGQHCAKVMHAIPLTHRVQQSDAWLRPGTRHDAKGHQKHEDLGGEIS